MTFLFSFLFYPATAHAQDAVAKTQFGDYSSIGGFISHVISTYAVPAAAVAALVMITFAGFVYVTAGASPEAASRAKEYITGAVLGLLTLFLLGYGLAVVLPKEELSDGFGGIPQVEGNLGTFSPNLSSQGASTTSTVSGPTASRIVQIVQNELGNREQGTSNSGPQIAKYFPKGAKHDQWCTYFVTWAVNQAGVEMTRLGHTKALMDYLKKNGQWSDGGTNAQPGDIIIFHSQSNSDYHSGIVEKVEAGKITSIEGNSSDKVKRNTYTQNSSKIVGVGRLW